VFDEMKHHLKEMKEAATLRDMHAKVAEDMQGSGPLPSPVCTTFPLEIDNI